MSHGTRTTTPETRVDAPHLVRGTSPLDVAETTFRLLTAGPSPLSMDGRRLGHGLPRRRIPLPELASILMHPSTNYEARDETWRLLVTRARTAGPGWVVGAVGVALPGLRAAAHRLHHTYSVDVQAELLAGFVVALRNVELDAPRVAQRLCSTAFVAARAALRASEPARAEVASVAPGSALPPPPFGHPDFVLARAVQAGVITAAEAELIGATRLEEISTTEYAQRSGQARWAVYKARARAEARLVAAIRCGSLSDPDAQVIAEATMTVIAEPGTRC
jgi:hypothetical protein